MLAYLESLIYNYYLVFFCSVMLIVEEIKAEENP